MSTFNRFLGKVGRGFKKVGDKVEDIGDNAASTVRAKALQIRIEEQYELLGEVVYRSQHTEEDLGEKIMELIATIDALFDELETIKAKMAARKAAPAKEAAEAEATEEAAPAQEVAVAPEQTEAE